MPAAQMKYSAGEPLPKPDSVVVQAGLIHCYLYRPSLTGAGWYQQNRADDRVVTELSVASKSKPWQSSDQHCPFPKAQDESFVLEALSKNIKVQIFKQTFTHFLHTGGTQARWHWLPLCSAFQEPTREEDSSHTWKYMRLCHKQTHDRSLQTDLTAFGKDFWSYSTRLLSNVSWLIDAETATHHLCLINKNM